MGSLIRNRPLRQRSEKAATFEREINAVRRPVLKRAHHRCELTGVRDESLHIHHPFGRHTLGRRWTNDPDCLVVVCRRAHRALTDAATPAAHALAAQARQDVVQRLMARYERLTGDRGAAGVVAGWTTTRAAIWLTEAIEKAEP
jgi:hypothetical protein